MWKKSPLFMSHRSQRIFRRRWAAAALLLTGLGPGFSAASGQSPDAAPALTVVERSLAQDQGGWLVQYRLRYHGPSTTVTAAEVAAKIEGWVSNSRVGIHALPRWSTVSVAGSTGLTALGDVAAAADESLRCRERMTVQITPDEPVGDPPAPAPAPSAVVAPSGSASASPSTSTSEKAPAPADKPALLPLSLTPGATVRVRLKLEHIHFLFGDYDPLLGVRGFELHLGAATFRDAIPLDQEQYLAQPKYTWPAPPEDRRDTRHYVSAPDSLHLEAHVPGNQYYRFPERPIRYGTKMRLRYWYYIAAGTEGDCRARIAQYKDTPTAWKVLAEGGHEECLNRVGRWTKVERIFRTEPDATTLALDFRISGADVGEMWIDDVRLEPIAGPGLAGP